MAPAPEPLVQFSERSVGLILTVLNFELTNEWDLHRVQAILYYFRDSNSTATDS